MLASQGRDGGPGADGRESRFDAADAVQYARAADSPGIEIFFTSSAEVVAFHEQPREDFYFLEPSAIGIADGLSGRLRGLPLESNMTEQFTFSCRQLIRGMVGLLREKSGGTSKDSRDSFMLDLDGNSSYLSCGTNKGQDNASFDQPRHDRAVYSAGQVIGNLVEGSLLHIEGRSASVCILRGNELFGATAGDSQFMLIHFVGTMPERVTVNKVSSTARTEHCISCVHSETDALREEDVATFSAKIQDRDLVIMGSSNLFGTVGPTAILGIVKEHVERRGFSDTFPQNLAKEIAAAAAEANAQAVPASFDTAKNDDVIFSRI